jgi:hypothetical protein
MAEIVAVSADGKKHVFPEGTKRDVIDRVMKDYAQKNPIVRAKAGPQVDTSTDLPLGERYEQGLQDQALGFMQFGSRVAPSMTPPPPPGMTEFPADVNPAVPEGLAPGMDAAVAKDLGDYTQRRELAGGKGMDIPRLLGNVSAVAPTAVLGGPSSPGWLSALLMGSAGGLASSVASPVEDTSQGYWKEKGKQALYGTAGGAAGGLVGKVATATLAPKIAPEVTSMMAKGGKPTVGQMLGLGGVEDRLTGIPILGNAVAGSQKRGLDSFQKVVYDDVLSPIGEKGPKDLVGYDGIDAVHKTVSDKYEELLPNLVFKADDQLTDELAELSSMAAEMPKEQAERFQDIVMKKFIGRLSKTDMMDGQTFKGVESELSRIAKELRADPSFDNRELGSAIREALVSVRESLERNNPMFAGRLQKINESFSKLVTLENAASRLGTDDGVFTPAQLMSAVRATDKSSRKNKFARGEAAMQDLAREGKKTFGAKYPDSGTVGRSIPAALATVGAGWADLGATAGGLTAASIPYTRLGQWIATKGMTAGSGVRGPLADILNRALMPAGAAGAGLTQP